MADGGVPTVLVVDDDPQVRSLYADYLGADYDVATAADGREALERLDETTDVVLLDRRMPGLDGDEVIERIRARATGCAIAVVTAVEPDVDVLDMGFDDYVVKPVSQADLLDLVERVERWREYDARVREYFTVASKVALLEDEGVAGASAADEGDLRARLEAVEAAAQQALDEAVEVGAFEAVVQRTVAAD